MVGSPAGAQTLAQQSPGKALSVAFISLLLALVGAAGVLAGPIALLKAWWSFALVVVSRFHVLFGLPLATAEGPPTFTSQHIWSTSYDAFRHRPWSIREVEIGGQRFRLSDGLVTSAWSRNLWTEYGQWHHTISESSSRRMERLELPFRAWYVPSTRIVVSIEWPVWAELHKLDLVEQGYADLHHSHVGELSPQVQARLQELHRNIEAFRASLQPGVPESVRRKLEERLDLLKIGSEIARTMKNARRT